MDEVKDGSDEGQYRSSDEVLVENSHNTRANPVDLFVSGQSVGHNSQTDGGTQIHQGGQNMIHCIQFEPQPAVVGSAAEEAEPEAADKEAGDGAEHHPAQHRDLMGARGDQQHPHQTTKHHLCDEQAVRHGAENSTARWQRTLVLD